jgi:hypothetical protein
MTCIGDRLPWFAVAGSAVERVTRDGKWAGDTTTEEDERQTPLPPPLPTLLPLNDDDEGTANAGGENDMMWSGRVNSAL